MKATYWFFGKEVRHPALKAAAILVAVVLFGAALVLSPILVPLHFVLWRLGRNGFYNAGRITIDASSLRKRRESVRQTLLRSRELGIPDEVVDEHMDPRLADLRLTPPPKELSERTVRAMRDPSRKG